MENNFINAYTITAKVEGESWKAKRATLKAANELEAIEKAKKVLLLEDKHTITAEQVKVYAINTKLQNDFYPYGREKCTAFYSVEYVKNKGCRTIFQTINPKNGRLNNPKKSTYTSVILPCEIVSNGHFDSVGYLDFNGSQSINEGLQFMNDFFELFTPEQIEDTALTILAMSKIDFKASVIYAGSEVETLKPLYEPLIKNLCEIAREKTNLFNTVFLDIDALNAAKKPNYNPFKVTTYTV